MLTSLKSWLFHLKNGFKNHLYLLGLLGLGMALHVLSPKLGPQYVLSKYRFPEISQNSFCYNFSFGGVSCTQCEISATVWEKHGWPSFLPPHSTLLDLVHLPFPASGWLSLFLLGYPCLISSLLCSGFKVPPSPLLIFHHLIY